MFSISTLRRHAWLRLLLGASRDWRDWPWRQTLEGLRTRFAELRLGLTAGSLTFTTLLALVPLAVLAFSLFTAFPVFSSFQKALEQFFAANLMPDAIVKPVMKSLTLFAGKAKGLGALGAVFLGVSALALMLTIDRTLNAIWRVRRPRPLAQRVLVYWAMLTLGPLVLGASLALTSYALTAGRGLVHSLPGGLEALLDLIQFSVLTLAVSGLFHFVPNTQVRWRHALLGGLFVAVGFSLAKLGLAWWVKQVPTYATLYGAFASLPIFLIWIYLGWVIVLLGALLAANAPGLTQRLMQRAPAPGLKLELALGVIRELWLRQQRGAAGAGKLALAQQLRIDPLQLEPVLETLMRLDWVGRLEDDKSQQRLVLLRNPHETLAAPLLHALLALDGPGNRMLWDASGWRQMSLVTLLGQPNRRASDWDQPSVQLPPRSS